jgi:hypothetical protein
MHHHTGTGKGLVGRDNQVVIPAMIVGRGNAAVRAFRDFFEDPNRTQNTRKLYGVLIRRFFRWAELKGLTLETIDASVLATYAAETAAKKSKHQAVIFLSPVRGVLGHFTQAGVLAIDPCPKGQPNGRRKKVPTNGPELPIDCQAGHAIAQINSRTTSMLLQDGDGEITGFKLTFPAQMRMTQIELMMYWLDDAKEQIRQIYNIPSVQSSA